MCFAVIVKVPTFVRLCYNLIFVCLAWSVNIFAQLTATRLRGYTSQEDSIRQLQESGYDCGDSTPQACFQNAIYKGYFLETTPTVVNAVFFAIAASAILWVKAKHRQYVLSCVFATICLVTTMSYGPLYPYFNGTLGVSCPSALSLLTSSYY